MCTIRVAVGTITIWGTLGSTLGPGWYLVNIATHISACSCRLRRHLRYWQHGRDRCRDRCRGIRLTDADDWLDGAGHDASDGAGSGAGVLRAVVPARVSKDSQRIPTAFWEKGSVGGAFGKVRGKRKKGGQKGVGTRWQPAKTLLVP